MAKRVPWRSLATLFPTNWTRERSFRVPVGLEKEFGPYYIDWGVENWTAARFDDNGVVLHEGSLAYHPVNIAKFGLHSHALWKARGDVRSRQCLFSQAQWLRVHLARYRGINGCYVYTIPLPAYGAQSGWISGMAQGMAISLLLRAHHEWPGLDFEEAAIRAAEPFRYELDKGGLVWRGSQGDVFFEEVAVTPPSHILNGNLFALFGLWELWRSTRLPWVCSLLEDAIRTVRNRLVLYDSGYWSYYSLLATRTGYRRVAILSYHASHIALLRVLAAMAGEPLFTASADKWQGYMDSSYCRRRVVENTIRGLLLRVLTGTRSVPGGERSVLPD